MPCPVVVANSKFEDWTAGDLDNWTGPINTGSGSSSWAEATGESGSALQLSTQGSGNQLCDAEYYIDGPSNARRKFVIKVRANGSYNAIQNVSSILMWREDSLSIPAGQQQNNSSLNNVYGTLEITVSPSRTIQDKLTIRLRNNKASGGGFGPRTDTWDELYIDFLGPPAVRALNLLRTPSANLRGADQVLLRAPC